MKGKIILLLTVWFIGVGNAMAQRTVKGTVYSAEDNEPIVGASVVISGTKTGTATDIDGRFTLRNVPNSAKTLLISYVGMKSQTVTIKPEMKIFLESDARSLDEVVVQVAYGSAKKSTLTGAISQVGKEKIELRPVSSVTSALEGTTSGIQINSTYGQPGSDAAIRIRGFGTVNGSSSPLYVLDGVPFNGNISDLNPVDIESITVLKDAASSALYGNRASNGVILITTKKGTSSKLSLNLRLSQGTYSRGIKEYKLLNPREFMETSWMSLRNSRISAGDDAAAAGAYATKNLIRDRLYLNIFNKANDQLFDSNGRLVSDASILPGYADDLDWYSNTIRHGARQEYSLSGNAATDKSDYYFSVGYLKENGYVTSASFKRLTGRAQMNFRPKKWLTTGFTLAASHQKSSFSDSGDSSFKNAFMYCRQIAPIYPVHLHNADGSYRLNANGNKQYDPGSYTDADGNTVLTRNQYPDRHVIWENELDKDRNIRNTIESTFYMDIKFLQDFTFTVKGQLGLRNNERHSFDNPTIGNGKGNHGRVDRRMTRYKNYTFQQQLNWGRAFDKHTVSALLGHENYAYNYDVLTGRKSEQILTGHNNLSNFSELTGLNGYEDNYRTESYLGRVRYNYDDKYTAEVSFRRDGSSRFYKESRWGNFGSVGANWMISREDFMRSVKWVNSLKLRADYGLVGNDAGSGYYAYLSIYGGTKNNNKGAYYLSQIGNEKLKWETGSSLGIGIDARLFNRWNISIDYFDRRNRDLLFDVYMPLSAGPTENSSAVASITKNLGTIGNKGFELNTDVDIYKSKDWTVNFATNASIIRNKVLKLPEQNKKGIISGIFKIVEGRSRYEFFTYSYVGVDRLTGNSMYKVNTDNYHYKDAAGNIVGNKSGDDITSKVTQINGEYYVNNTTYAMREYHGSAIPKLYGSFTPTVRWKSLSLSVLCTYSLGGKVYDSNYADLMSVSNNPQNYSRDVLKSWKAAPEGMTATSPDRMWYGGIPQINSTTSKENNATSSRWLTSANYLVIKNVNLAYQLPKAWIRTLELESVRLSVTAENLATFTARRGMNPQQSFNGTQYNYLVTPRVFTIGLDVKF